MMWLGELVTKKVQNSSENNRGWSNCSGIVVDTHFPIVPPLSSPLPFLCLPAPAFHPASILQAPTRICGWKKKACWSHMPGSLAPVVFAAGQKKKVQFHKRRKSARSHPVFSRALQAYMSKRVLRILVH